MVVLSNILIAPYNLLAYVDFYLTDNLFYLLSRLCSHQYTGTNQNSPGSQTFTAR